MNKDCWILMSNSCRSDQALIKPISDRLEQEDWCVAHYLTLRPGNYLESYKICENYLNKYSNYDLCIVIGDRIEQLALCQCAFFHNIPIAVYGSGITNTIATFDDINRHSIALMADVCLCEDQNSAKLTKLLKEVIQKITNDSGYYLKDLERHDIHVVGNLYLDTIDNIDESLVPSEPYDLILINPETLLQDKQENIHVFYKAWEFIDKDTIWIGGNPDCSMNIDTKNYQPNFTTYYENVPRSQFLGLLRNCERFITNSSSAYYEAPYFLKPEQIIQVGERNKNRSTPREWNQDYKTSERIVEIIKKWWSNKNA